MNLGVFCESAALPSRRRETSARWAEVALAFAVFLFALLVRIPNLQTIPQITDEWAEVHEAVRMVKEHRWPLVAVDAYDGPLFIYLLSFVFRVVGFQLWIPRGFVLVTGALTVVLTYLFAREVARGDRRTALFAAAALAVNAHHAAFTSHLAFSNSTTPLFTTLAAWLYHRATRRRRPALLVAAGSVYGLALQTHPSALALAPGFVVDFLCRRETRAWLRHLPPVLALAAAIGAYAPVLYYNATSNMSSLRVAERRTYAFETSPSPERAFGRIRPFLGIVGRMAIGDLQPRQRTSLAVIFFWGATALILVTQARRGEPLLLLIIASAAVFFVFFSRYYENPFASRYYMALLPLLATAWASAVVDVRDAIPSRAFAQIWLIVAAAIILLGPLARLRDYYRWVYATGTENSSLLAIAARLCEDRAPPALLDNELAKVRNRFGGSPLYGLAYYLELEERPFSSISFETYADRELLKSVVAAHPRGYLVASAAAGRRLATDLPLVKVVAARFPCATCGVPEDYALFSWSG